MSKLSERFEGLDGTTQDFASGLIRLARYWRGEEGAKTIHSRVNHNLSNGLPIEEALIEAYRFVRDKVL